MIAAGGSGTLSWYADAGLTTLLGTGSSLLIPSPADSITIYLVQDQFGCEGPPLAIAVNVVQTPVNVTLDGPDHFCEQASGSITASGPPGMEGSWSTPSGPYGGTVLEFASVQLADSGWYILLPSVAGCIGTADSIHMAVLVPVPIDLGPDTTFCEGAQFTLSMPPGFTDPVWSTGETGFAITVTAGGTFGVDCSGLTQMLFLVSGIKLPRDAWQQAELGKPVELIGLSATGDLAFFDNEEGRIVHVGIVLENNRILHASGRVRIDSLDQEGIFNTKEKKYTHKLRTIKRVV